MRKKQKNSKKRKISFFKILALLLFLMSVFMGIIFSKIDILPTKYFLALIAILFFTNIICDIFLMRKKFKKLRIFFSMIVVILIFFMGIVSYFVLSTLGFLGSIRETNYKTENYSVVVLSNSNYEEIKDVKNLDIGYYSNSLGASKANKELKKKVDVDFKKYTDLNELANDLLDKKIEVMVIEDSVLSVLKEDVVDFENSIKVIYQFSVKMKAVTTAKDVNVIKEPFNIYLSGIDTYGEISSVSRSDVNMVVTVNPKTKQLLLTSIPRDYYVQLHDTTGAKDKLTHAGMYGIDMSISTIEDLLDIEINYYFKVNFTSLIDIVDALGGVTVYSDYTFTSIDGLNYKKGNNKMNGEEALSFARERKAFNAGDRQRVKNQQAVISAIINKVCSKSILLKYDSLLDSLSGEFQTNMSSKKITSLIKMQLNDMATWNISTYSLEGVDSRGYTYSGGNVQLYVMEPVLGSVDEATSLINSVIKGDKLESAYVYDGPINTVEKSNQNNTIKIEQDENKKEPKEEVNDKKDKNQTELDKKDKAQTEEEKKDKKNPVEDKKSVDYEYPNCQKPVSGYCEYKEEVTVSAVAYCKLSGLDPIMDDKGNYICSDGEEISYSCIYDEYELIGNKCIKNTVEKVPVCDNEYKYNESYKICCPAGYSYNASKDMCVEN